MIKKVLKESMLRVLLIVWKAVHFVEHDVLCHMETFFLDAFIAICRGWIFDYT